MKLRRILIGSTVGDEAVAASLQIELGDEGGDGGEKIDHEIGILRAERAQIAPGTAGHDEDVQRVGGLWVMEGDQRRRLTQALQRDDEAHMRKYPGDTAPPQRRPCRASP